MTTSYMEAKARFWRKVNKLPGNGCWEWTASLDKDGYGQFSLGASNSVGRIKRAHRVSWMWAHSNVWLALLDHRCWNRKCVRPSHLRESTDNRDSNRVSGLPLLSKTEGIEERNGQRVLVTTFIRLLPEI